MLEILLINPVTRNPFPYAVVRDRKVFAIADGEHYLVKVLYNGSHLYRERTYRDPLVEITVAVNGFDTLASIQQDPLQGATLDTPGIVVNSGKLELEGFRLENEECLKFKGHQLLRGTQELHGVVWAAMHAGGYSSEKRSAKDGDASWVRGIQNGFRQEFPREVCAVEFDDRTRLKQLRGIEIPLTNDFWPLQDPVQS